MSQGQLIATWQDARIYAAAAATAWFFWRRDILGTILSGMAVLLAISSASAGDGGRRRVARRFVSNRGLSNRPRTADTAMNILRFSDLVARG